MPPRRADEPTGRGDASIFGLPSEREEVLAHLPATLARGTATLMTDAAGTRLTIRAPDAAPLELSKEAAEELLNVAARQSSEMAYLAALVVNPRYGRWSSQFVSLAGTLTTVEHPAGWSDVLPEYTLVELTGEGPSRQLRRTRLNSVTDVLDRHTAIALLGEPGSGKTTTLYKLALDAAQQRLAGAAARLPIF